MIAKKKGEERGGRKEGKPLDFEGIVVPPHRGGELGRRLGKGGGPAPDQNVLTTL